jgi:peptide deformylase
MVLSIITRENPILRQKAREIEEKEIKSSEIKELICDMKETVEKASGIGLAAPQIGKPLRIVIIFLGGKKIALINPKITKYSWRKECAEEGCLSVPGFFGKVKRAKKITVTALNEDGQNINFIAEDLFARVIQHEIDHLDGILFIDKALRIYSVNTQ